MPISDRRFLMHSKPPSPNILHTWKPLSWYACMTCWTEIIIVLDVLSRISLAVPKCLTLEVVTLNGILVIAIMSIASVTFPYFSSISLGTCVLVICKCSVGHLVVLPFFNPRLGQICFWLQNVLSCNVTVCYQMPSTYFIKSSVLSLPIVSCRACAFIA